MPDLPLYLLKEDVKIINDWIDLEEELFYIIPDGNQRWKAVSNYNLVLEAVNCNQNLQPPMLRFSLWLRSSGALPLLPFKGTWSFENGDQIDDPCKGWKELRQGADRSRPYFGPGHFGVFHLEIGIRNKDIIPKSHFSWIGNHYQKSPELVNKFWQKIRRMARKNGEFVLAANNKDMNVKVLAFPSAYAAIRAGAPSSLI